MYTYKRLTLERPAIRLLTLHPSDWNSPTKCNLHHASLDENPAFEASSYMLGDVKDTIEILVDSHKFPVTKNLHQALRYLRREAEPRTLWIDALCINQGDISERSQQVCIM